MRSISIAGATARFEALGFAAGVGYGSEAVGTGGVGIGEVVDLAEGTRALDEALALQRADVAAQVVGKGFVEAVGGGGRAAGIDIEIGRCFQAAEGVVGEGVGLPFAAAHAPGHLRDVAALLQRAAQAADRVSLITKSDEEPLWVISDSRARGCGEAGAGDCGGAGVGEGGGDPGAIGFDLTQMRTGNFFREAVVTIGSRGV